jgi:sec-independent protein translocase protein TatB
MFGIGMPELILILVVALIVIGPKKLPDMARSLGKALNEFKSATQDFKDSIDTEVKDIKNIENKDIGRIGKRTRQDSGTNAQENKTGAMDETEQKSAADEDMKTGIAEYDDPASVKQEKAVKTDE